MSEARLTPKQPDYPLRRRVAGLIAATAVGAGLIASGALNEPKPSVSSAEQDKIEEVRDTINTLPRDQHILTVVGTEGDNVWEIVESVAHAQGFDGDIRPAVDEAIESNPALSDGLHVGETVPVDLDLLQK